MYNTRDFRTTKEFNDNDRFIRVQVYRHPSFKGIGRTHHSVDHVYIPAEMGNYTFSELKEEEILAIFYPEHRGRDHWALKPYLEPTGMIGPMADGNLAYCSDSRCERVYHIHDRYESQEMYNTLSA